MRVETALDGEAAVPPPSPRALVGHTGLVESIAFSPDGKTALTGGDDHTARLWDLATGKELQSLPHGNKVTSVAFSPDGRFALTGSLDGLRRWDVHSGTFLNALLPAATSPATACSAVAFSPDGHTVLAAMQSGTLRLLDAVTGAPVRDFAGGHTAIVGRVAFSPDGATAVSAGDDKTLRLWDVASGAALRVLTVHTNQVRCAAFSPDGHTLLSGDLDGLLEQWDLSRPAAGAPLESEAAAARLALAKNPRDGAALAALGRWYAYGGIPDWAADLLERARAAGADVSPLVLGRCYWELNDRERALAELRKAVERKEAPARYLERCIGALGRDSSTQGG